MISRASRTAIPAGSRVDHGESVVEHADAPPEAFAPDAGKAIGSDWTSWIVAGAPFADVWAKSTSAARRLAGELRALVVEPPRPDDGLEYDNGAAAAVRSPHADGARERRELVAYESKVAGQHRLDVEGELELARPLVEAALGLGDLRLGGRRTLGVADDRADLHV